MIRSMFLTILICGFGVACTPDADERRRTSADTAILDSEEKTDMDTGTEETADSDSNTNIEGEFANYPPVGDSISSQARERAI